MTDIGKIASPQAFIDGSLVDARSERTFDTLNPSNGQRIASVACCDEVDVNVAVAAARRAFDDDGVWRHTSPRERKIVMLRFADLVEARASDIAMLDAVDAGKPIVDCETLDLPEVLGALRWYAELADKEFGKISPTGADSLGLVTQEPVGVVGIVIPWNFPAATLSWKLAPALAAGNSVVVKPAELAPLSSILLAELALEAGIPRGVLNVVPGLGHEAGRAIGLHPGIDVVSFTGSLEVGRMFLRYSADSNLKGIVLECGGKSPQIVMGDVASQIDNVAEELAGAAFWNAGQNCTCGSRILVSEDVHDEFVSRLVGASQTWVVGDPMDRSTKVGPLIESSALDRSEKYVNDAVAEGARAAFGGVPLLTETGGWYYSPTVLTDVTPDMAVARDEIFGPVVSVIPFRDESEAVSIANDSEFGLAASVFTNDLNRAHRMARSLRAGTVSVNCYSEGDITTPFGGFKGSGFGGRDKGIEAMRQYTELKTTWLSLAP